MTNRRKSAISVNRSSDLLGWQVNKSRSPTRKLSRSNGFEEIVPALSLAFTDVSAPDGVPGSNPLRYRASSGN